MRSSMLILTRTTNGSDMRLLRIISCTFFVIYLALGSAVYGSTNGSLIDELRQYQETYKSRSNNTTIESIGKMEKDLFTIFDAFDRASLRGMDSEALEELFNSLNVLSFYSAKTEHALLLRKAYEELKHRELDTAFHAQQVYGALIQARRFDDARGLAASTDFHLGRPLPQTKALSNDVAGPTLWRISDHGITEKSIALDEDGLSIVVVAHPLCAFSVKAMESIEANEELKRRFKDSYWITPPDRRLGLDELRAWNQKATVTGLSLIGDSRNWPIPDAGTTPTFYIFRNGQLDQTLQGWPSQEMEHKLLSALTTQ